MRRTPSSPSLSSSTPSGLVTALAPWLIAALAACGPVAGGDDDGDGDGSGPDAGPGDIDAPTAAEECRKMDLVFIVDDSGSMSEEQTSLASNFPMFANVLNTYTISSGEQLDYRAAITTTGVTATFTIMPPPIPGFPPFPPVTQSQTGTDGKFRTTCNLPRPWLERTDPDMANKFACAARVGTGGPALEMPLRAAELAVAPATNPGFVRSDALLGIVIITDEDDCSRRISPFNTAGDGCAENNDPDLATVSSFVTGFDQLKGDRGRWATAVIAAPADCMSQFGNAANAIRLKQFAQEAGTNAVFSDICAGNLAPALQQALDTFEAACENFPPIGRTVPQ